MSVMSASLPGASEPSRLPMPKHSADSDCHHFERLFGIVIVSLWYRPLFVKSVVGKGTLRL